MATRVAKLLSEHLGSARRWCSWSTVETSTSRQVVASSSPGSLGHRFFSTGSAITPVQSLELRKGLQSGARTTGHVRSQEDEAMLRGLLEARARIFGHVIGNGQRSGHKVLRKKLIGEKLLGWYETPIQKRDPMYEDPKEKRRLLKLERLKRRGKGPPKKGHGKRAAKRAK
ncbi:unnamed protein product [Sphagnum balticum]